MRRLEDMIARTTGQDWAPEESPSTPQHTTPPVESQDGAEPASLTTQHLGPREVVMDLDSGPGAIPGFKVQAAPRQHPAQKDIIARGTITLEQARKYFHTYQDRLDHFPYRILGEHSASTLECIRETSPLLTAAVCAVGALHLASNDFDRCYEEFLSLSAAQSFSKGTTIDDVRALCIGAFWLSDLSWTLVGAAVRIATELQLHKSFPKAIRGDKKHYFRTRLYYLVYAADHQCSVAYGRPPMTRECEAIRDARKFLECEHATGDDARIVSHILRWSLCSNVFDTFGVDVDRPLCDSDIPHLRRFSIALDSLRAEWTDRHGASMHVGNYPNKGIRLQYHFANLYLCSHAFRGAGSSQVLDRPHDLALELDEISNSAVQSALCILRTVESDAEIQSFLNGLPVYFDTMIAFAVVFLLKVSTKFSTSVRIDIGEVKRLMGALVKILKRETARMHPRHMLVSITKGIESLVHRCGLWQEPPGPTEVAPPAPRPLEASYAGFEIPNADFGWSMDEGFDPTFMSEFDFLVSQDVDVTQNFSFENPPSAS